MKIWRPYSQMKTAQPPLAVNRSEDSYLFLKNGQKVLDGISSWWVITHGHNHPWVVEAIQKQSAKLDQVVFANFTHEPAEELVEKLASYLPDYDYAFFSDNGSTAVEVAMKMSYQACQQQGKSRNKFLAFTEAYHGDTCGAMSVTADGVYTQAYQKMRFEVIRCRQGLLASDSEASWLEDFYIQLEKHKKEICAVIIEPLLQGAGGMIVWPEAVVKKIVEVCRKEDIYVIFDEVMTGFGRVGSLFALQKLNVKPDFVCLSKGLTAGFLPLSLTLTHSDVYDCFYSDDKNKMLFHGHSFTGNPISCAAAVANLNIWQQNSVLEKIRSLSQQHEASLKKIASRQKVKEVRWLGAMGALHLSDSASYASPKSQAWMQSCLSKGLFLRPLGSVIYLLPPYCTSTEDLAWAWDIVEECVFTDWD